MTLSRVERALGMMRVYLVESSADDDWGDDRAEELATNDQGLPPTRDR